jgi:membrane associated rhomboid family serine protease
VFPIRDTIPNRFPPLMVWTLIAANAAVFVFELGLSEAQLRALFQLFGLVPARYSHPHWAVWLGLPIDDYWPLLTHMFLHGGWLHVIANMWTLWIFGDNVEDRMGPLRFLAFYLLCGIIAAVVHWATNASSTMPTIGASGAISGVLAAYFVLYPKARVVTVIPIFFYPLFVVVPAVTYVLIWFISQVFVGVASLGQSGDAGGVAWWAHIGGFIAGLVLYRSFLSHARDGRLYQDQWGLDAGW